MSDLIVAGRTPDNIKLPFGMNAVEVGSDLFEISKRIQEIHRSLFVVALDPPQKLLGGGDAHWAVMQHMDQEEHLLFKAEELDQRVLDRAAEIVHVPLRDRLALIEKQEKAAEAERMEQALEEHYETTGGPMRHLLYQTGFTEFDPAARFRKLNKTARRHGRRV